MSPSTRTLPFVAAVLATALATPALAQPTEETAAETTTEEAAAAPAPAESSPGREPGEEAVAEDVAGDAASGQGATLDATSSPVADSSEDLFSWYVASDTYLRILSHAPAPGPGSTVVGAGMQLPIYEYASLRVVDLDMPWQDDSLDVELALWGQVTPGEITADRRRGDGDITVANVRQRFGPAYVRLGRQQYAGGAARFIRFDGLSAGFKTPIGLGLDGYGGFTVLPRWDRAPGYHGFDATDLVRDLEGVPEPSREQYWMAGGRLYYYLMPYGELGASFHEQRDLGELGRRQAGVDLRVTPISEIELSGSGVLDIDAVAPSEIRGAIDAEPIDHLVLRGDYHYLVPAMYLSHQSVLSVFADGPHHEAGGFVGYQLFDMLDLGGGYHVAVFEEGEIGGNGEALVRFFPFDRRTLVVQAGYTRFTGSVNGYHGVRGSVGYQVIEPLRLTADSYGYFYDEAIRGKSAAWVGTLSGELSTDRMWSVLLSGSMALTPYSDIDAQTMARLKLLFDGGGQ